MPNVWVIILCCSENQENFCRELTSEISFVAAQKRESDKDMANVCINHQPCISVVQCYSILLAAGFFMLKKVGGWCTFCFHSQLTSR